MRRRNVVGLVVALVVGACGRLHFDTDSGADAADGGDAEVGLAIDVVDTGDAADSMDAADTSDATDGDIGVDAPRGPRADLTTLAKFTTSMPIMAAPPLSSSDCGFYLSGWVHVDPTSPSSARVIRPFFHDGLVWFGLPCKYGDSGGWLFTVGSWDPEMPGAPFVRVDPNPGMIGAQHVIGPGDMTSPPVVHAVTNMGGGTFTSGIDGQVRGFVTMNPVSAGGWGWDAFSVTAPSPDLIRVTSIDTSAIDAFELAAGDGTFRGATSSAFTILTRPTGYYVYTTTWAQPDRSRFFVVATPSADLRTPSGPPVMLSEGWADAHVWEWGGAFHMIAREMVRTNAFYYVRGTSPTSFDFAGAVRLNLNTYVGTPGAWDELLYAQQPVSADPSIAGVVLIRDTVYIFYVAGVAGLAPAMVPYGMPRSVGAFTVRMTS